MASELARQKVAVAWCTPETSNIEMDARLAEAFADILDKYINTLRWFVRNCEPTLIITSSAIDRINKIIPELIKD